MKDKKPKELPAHIVRSVDFDEPKKAEIDGWLGKDVVEEVERSQVDGQILSLRWIGTKKPTGRLKARLVVRGYEDMEETEDSSPTSSPDGRRMVCHVAATKKWILHSADIK